MFGGLAHLINSAPTGSPPKDVPEATPVKLPGYTPQPGLSGEAQQEVTSRPQHHGPPSLVPLLQSIYRPADLEGVHFDALGVNVHLETPAEDLVPARGYLPSSSGWDHVTVEEAQERDPTFKYALSNGGNSPDARTYLERRHELATNNQAAFRTVRRLRPEPGRQPPRLGHCYEFFKQLELMAAFWEDSSLISPQTQSADSQASRSSSSPAKSSMARTHPIDASLEQAGHAMIASQAKTNHAPKSIPGAKQTSQEQVTYRTSTGSQMPAEFRRNLVTAFLKLVTYDFGCNICPPRVEPRVHLLEPPRPDKSKSRAQKASQFPAGCSFLYRRPVTRDAARAGIFEGPAAAVCVRNTTAFNTLLDERIDLGRELVSAFATAQLRRRQGKTEKIFGQGRWWTTVSRWGGGEGGPIGREVEGDSVAGDKEPGASSDMPDHRQIQPPWNTSARSRSPDEFLPVPRRILPSRSHPLSKKRSRHQSAYDNYRAIRPSTSNWDPKTHYEAIGRVRGANHDDVFMFSSLFHHLSIVRVRIPDQILDLLEGGRPQPTNGSSGDAGPAHNGESPGVQVWRSQWFDLFQPEDRLEAMRTVWGVVGWLMRAQEDERDASRESF